jgi:SOS response regulatory protein OraA/RecX
MAGRRPRESYAERRERHAEVEDPAVVLEAAARFLEARSRSVAEVRRRLTWAGYRVELVDASIDRLSELGMLDDEAFARAWVESRDRARPRGERAIREELRTKGIDRSIVDAVLAERREAGAAVGAGPDPSGDPRDDTQRTPIGAERDAADRLLAKHARTLARVADVRQRRQRAYALLARNGFDPETCRESAAAWMQGGGAGDPTDIDAETGG